MLQFVHRSNDCHCGSNHYDYHCTCWHNWKHFSLNCGGTQTTNEKYNQHIDCGKFFRQTSCLTMLIVRPNIINLSTVLMMIVTRKHICDALSFFVFVFSRSYIQPKYYDKKMKNISYLMNGSQLDIRQLLTSIYQKNVHTYFNLSHNNSFFFNFLDVS